MPTRRPIRDILDAGRGTIPADRRQQIDTLPIDQLLPEDILQGMLHTLEDMDAEGDRAERFVRAAVLQSEFISAAASPGTPAPNTDERISILRRIESLSSELAEVLAWENENRFLELHGSLQQYVNPDAGPADSSYWSEPGEFDERSPAIAIETQGRLCDDLQALARAAEFAQRWQDEALRPVSRATRLNHHQLVALFLWDQCRSLDVSPQHPSSPRGELADLFNLICRLAGLEEKADPAYYLDQFKGDYCGRSGPLE